LDTDGDLLTNLEEYEGGSDPADYYNGTAPILEIISGNNQSGNPLSYSAALVVKVKNAQTGDGLPGAPLHLQVTQGGGKLVTVNAPHATEYDSLELKTDNNGLAKLYENSTVDVYYRHPSASGVESIISITAGSAVPATFLLNTSSNLAPEITVMTPANGAKTDSGQNISLSATATDSDGSITNLSFYLGSTLLGQGTQTGDTWHYSWQNAAAGHYTVLARAVDNQGSVAVRSIHLEVLPQADDNKALSEVMGGMVLNLPGASDTISSMPLIRPAVFAGKIQSMNGSVVSVSHFPNWTLSRFVQSGDDQPNTYLLYVTTGALAGSSYRIAANGADSLTLDTISDALTSLQPGDLFRIFPLWTLSTAFPESEGIVDSPSEAELHTEVLLPDLTGTGINLPPAATFVKINGTWRKLGQALSDFAHTSLPLGRPFKVRQPFASDSTKFIPVGDALSGPNRMTASILANASSDAPLASVQPSAYSLAESGFVDNGFFRISSDPLQLTDELLVYDNVAAQLNKQPSAVYYFYNGGWRKTGASVTEDFGHTVFLLPGAGFILRRAEAAVSPTTPWINWPDYQ